MTREKLVPTLCAGMLSLAALRPHPQGKTRRRRASRTAFHAERGKEFLVSLSHSQNVRVRTTAFSCQINYKYFFCKFLNSVSLIANGRSSEA